MVNIVKFSAKKSSVDHQSIVNQRSAEDLWFPCGPRPRAPLKLAGTAMSLVRGPGGSYAHTQTYIYIIHYLFIHLYIYMCVCVCIVYMHLYSVRK